MYCNVSKYACMHGDAAPRKARERARKWPWITLGLQFSAHVHNIYVVSTFAFIAQLETPPAHAIQTEGALLRHAAPGPGNWFEPDDLFLLEAGYGMSFRFRSLKDVVLASQMRVAIWEDAANGGLQVHRRARELRTIRMESDHLNRLIRWRSWYVASFLFALESSVEPLGTSLRRLLRSITAGAPRPWTRHVAERAKKGTQREVYRRLAQLRAGTVLERSVEKLTRWRLPGHGPALVQRILERLAALMPLVPPRVQSAVFSTLWNRWRTKRRFQRREGPCKFGRARPAPEDSIEHYLECPVTLEAAHRRLRLPLAPDTARRALLLATAPPGVPDVKDWLAKCAVLVYALYRARNAARYSGPTPAATASRAVRQALYAAARGHPRAARAVDVAFAR